jgi:hypothetical protein
MMILNQVERASHFVKVIVACPHRLPKRPESTLRKQARPNNGSLFCSHCGRTPSQRLLAHDLLGVIGFLAKERVTHRLSILR